ncbi:MAG: glycosyltransferase family 4 protein [Armatimonadota bacterium]
MIDVLILVPKLPYPVMDGDSVRHYNLIKRLSNDCNISLICYCDEKYSDVGIAEMEKYCKNIRAIPHKKRSKLEWLKRFASSYIKGSPSTTAVHYSPDMKHAVVSLLKEHKFDIVQIEHTFMSEYIDDVKRFSSAHTILTVHNLEAINVRRKFKHQTWGHLKVRHMIDTAVYPGFEKRAINSFNACVTVSELNAELIRPIRKDVIVVENGVDIALNSQLPVNPELCDLVFIGGMDYLPNIDGATFMVESILPLIRQKMMETKLYIVGRNPVPEVMALGASDGVEIHADVPDVKPWYEKAAITVVPLRSGGGTRLKILESMALGVPVVSTSIGCEGLDVTDKENILIADTPSEFAECVCRLLQNPELRTQLSQNARSLVEHRYSWDAIAPKLMDVYTSLLETNHPAQG